MGRVLVEVSMGVDRSIRIEYAYQVWVSCGCHVDVNKRARECVGVDWMWDVKVNVGAHKSVM